MGPEKPSCIARSGLTTPILTVRCFQMRLSVSKVSYSSTHLGNLAVKASMKSSSEPARAWLSRSTSFCVRQRDGKYFGMASGRSRYTPPGR